MDTPQTHTQLLTDVHTALLAAGWKDDVLLQRVRFAVKGVTTGPVIAQLRIKWLENELAEARKKQLEVVVPAPAPAEGTAA